MGLSSLSFCPGSPASSGDVATAPGSVDAGAAERSEEGVSVGVWPRVAQAVTPEASTMKTKPKRRRNGMSTHSHRERARANPWGVDAQNEGHSGLSLEPNGQRRCPLPRDVAQRARPSLSNELLLAQLVPLPQLLALVALLAAGCGKDPSSGGGGAAPRSNGAPTPSTQSASKTEPPAQAPSAAPSPTPPPQPAAEAPSLATPATWQLGELSDVGPAAPASATETGIALVTKDDRLLLSRLDGAGRFSPIDQPKTDFAKYGRGPAVVGRRAYWTTLRGDLLRAPLDGSAPPERLLGNVRAGARVSALRVGERDLVAIVREQDERAMSQLWSSTGELLALAPDSQTATNIVLVADGTTPLALTLEGRTSMSPVHATRLRVAPKRVNIESSQVIWVGPGSEPLTELAAVPTGDGHALALLATAHSITEFGLGHFDIAPALPLVEHVTWLPFPNGIDPAPVAGVNVCGAPFVFFAKPSDARPRSPQELHVAKVQDGKLVGGEVLARSRAFNDISVAPRPGGAVLAWTADRHTWAMTLGCPKP